MRAVRRVLLSVAVGLAGATAVAGAGWSLEAAALPPPEHADQVTAHAIGWLAKHPFAVDVFHVGHHRLDGACSQGWVRSSHTKRVLHGTLVSLRPGPVVLFARHRVFVIHGARLPFLPASLAAAVGCPRRLASTLDHATRLGDPITAERSYAANQPVLLRIEIRRVRHERLTLYLSPHHKGRLVAAVVRNGRVVTARISLGSATPRALRRFHIPRRMTWRRR